jgi:hypothetical protein
VSRRGVLACCTRTGRVARVDQLPRMAMAIQHLSRGAQAQRNDDHVAIFSAGAMTHVLVIDGVTSVADLDDIDPIRGDVAWFVQHVASRAGRDCAIEPVAAGQRAGGNRCRPDRVRSCRSRRAVPAYA